MLIGLGCVEVDHGGRLSAMGGVGQQVVAAELPGTVLSPAFESPFEAKSYIAGLDFFMGTRMRACIGVFSSDVPVVPLAYNRKFEGLFGLFGYTCTVDCTTETAEVILAKILAAWDDRATLTAEAPAALEQGRARLGAFEVGLK